MIARIGYFGDLTPAQLDAQEKNGERFFPAITSQPGIVAAFWLHGDDGRRLSVSVWESEEALAEGSRRADGVPLLPGMRGEEIPGPEHVEIWEVNRGFLAAAQAVSPTGSPTE